MLRLAKPRSYDHSGDPWVERTIIGCPTTIIGDVGEKSCAGKIIAAIFPFFFFLFQVYASDKVSRRSVSIWRNERKIRIRTELTWEERRKPGSVSVSQKLYLDHTMPFYILKPFEFPVDKSFNFFKKQGISAQNHTPKYAVSPIALSANIYWVPPLC